MNKTPRTLLLDIGNTRVKWCYLQQQQLSDEHAFVRDDENFDHQLNGIEIEGVSAVWVSSVAQAQVRTSVCEWACHHGLDEPQFVTSPSKAYGLCNGYREPEQLGVDRWLAMLGAWSQAPRASLVVDAGTALTLDAISPQGQHLGGLIVPGLQLMRRSLLDHTSQIQLHDASPPPDWGRSTTQAVETGTVLSLVSLVEHQYAQLNAQWPELRCVVTGGDSEALHTQLQANAERCTDLIFRGLQCYAEGAA